MSRKIGTLQNEPKILKLLFLQREKYNNAECYWRYKWIASWTLLGVNIFATVVIIKSSDLYIVFDAIIIIIIAVFECLSKKNHEIGAKTKQYIDDVLFNFKNGIILDSKDDILEFATECCERYEKDYKIQIENTGSDCPPGLKNWYNVIDSVDTNEIIFECQKENSWWQKKLFIIYRNWLYVIIIIITITLIILFINGITVKTIILFFLSNVSIFLNGFEDIFATHKYNIMLEKIQEDIQMIEKAKRIGLDQLKQLQANINSLREIRCFVPNILHSKKSTEYHLLYSKINKDKEP